MEKRKEYEEPFAEKIEFDYRDQVIASTGTSKHCYMLKDTAWWMCVDHEYWNN